MLYFTSVTGLSLYVYICMYVYVYPALQNLEVFQGERLSGEKMEIK